MADIETVVRPFQLPQTAPEAQQFVALNQPSNPPLLLQFGRSGTGLTFDASYSHRVTKYMDQAVVELAQQKSGTHL